MRTKIVIAMFIGFVLGASLMTAIRSFPQREMPKAEPVDKCQVAKIATEWFKNHYQNVKLRNPVVTDDGTVISEKDLTHIFDFWRGCVS